MGSRMRGIQESYAFVKDPSVGDSNSSSDLDMGRELMLGSWKDSRPVGGHLNFTVVYLITGRNSRIDDKLWAYLVFSSMA